MRRAYLTCLLLFASCGTVDFATVNPAEFGPEPNAETLRTQANNHLQNVLKDPESLRLRWFDDKPRQSALWTGLVGGGWKYGWAMRMGVNAKNSYGGYTGEKAYYVMQAGGQTYVGEQPGDNHFQVR